MVETQNPSNYNETVEKTEDYLPKSCLSKLEAKTGCSQEEIFKVANSRLGWYRRCGMSVVNFIISKDLLENRIKDGAGLLNPLSYYLVKVGI